MRILTLALLSVALGVAAFFAPLFAVPLLATAGVWLGAMIAEMFKYEPKVDRYELTTPGFNYVEDLEAATINMVSTLSIYADPSFYHACSFEFDPPTGGFDQDFTFDAEYDRNMPGRAARECLASLNETLLEAIDMRHHQSLNPTPETTDGPGTEVDIRTN